MTFPNIVAGIDVGGKRKGFHAVALSDGEYLSHYQSTSATSIANWCRSAMRAQVIGIDAPCRWSIDGRSRLAERQLMDKGIWCFSTPTRKRALNHPTDHYGWMLNGAQLFAALKSTHPLCEKLPLLTSRKHSFETFPHAISVAMRNAPTSARNKRRDRRALLQQAGVDMSKLTNIDLVDAALCALTAHLALLGRVIHYGEPETGLILVPV